MIRRRGDWDRIAPYARVACAVAGGLLLAQCSGGLSSKVDPKYGVSASPRVVGPGEPVPKGGGVYRVGKPYQVAGRTFVPRDDRDYRAEGWASWYGDDFHGRLTANGEVYDMHSLSAAHPTLPLPSHVRVTNLRNGRSVIVRVNDRGPFLKNRIIDLSVRTAKVLGFHSRGLARVRVEYVGRAPLEGSDDRMLVATLRENGPAPAPSRVMVASAKPFLPPVRRSLFRPDGDAPEGRPFGRDRDVEIDNDAPKPTRTIAVRRAPSELTAAARVDRTFGPGPAMASITDPSAAPSAGVLSAAAATPTVAYAPSGPAAGAAFMGGRGLY